MGILKNADELLLLMKQEIDNLLAGDRKLQQFLTWVEEKSCSVKARYKSATIRAFYFAAELAIDTKFNTDLDNYFISLACDLDYNFKMDLTEDFASFPDLALDLNLIRALYYSGRDLEFLTDHLNLANVSESELQHQLLQMKEQIPSTYEDDWEENFEQWWNKNGSAWTKQLRTLMIKYRNIGHEWQFNDSQKELLRQYYDANKMLVDCLNSDCYVSRDVRQEIEDTLLLPVPKSDEIK